MTRAQKLTFEVTAKDADLLPVHRSDASLQLLVNPVGFNLTTQPATYENRSGVSIYKAQYQPSQEGEHMLYITDVFGIKVRLPLRLVANIGRPPALAVSSICSCFRKRGRAQVPVHAS